MTTLARALRFVNRSLRDFEAGAFEGLEPVAWEQDRSDVHQVPGSDFLPGPVGQLYRGMIEVEWHPPFDWSPLEELASSLDEDPQQAATLDGRTLCQLLVAHGRAERFTDGLFLSRVQSGQMRALLGRFRVLAAGREGEVVDLHALRDVPPRRCQRRPRRCKACRSSRIASILYGMPAFDPELEGGLEAGRVVLGGCVVSGDDPAWQCVTCGAQIFVTGAERDSLPWGEA